MMANKMLHPKTGNAFLPLKPDGNKVPAPQVNKPKGKRKGK